jgi:predicted lipid-binding transport protein (Tim44 family)
LSLDPLNIILIAAAVIIFWRLKSVLGQRTGLERPPIISMPKSPPDLKVIENPQIIPPSPVWQGHAEEGSDLARGLEAISNQQKDFDVTSFIAGAKSAHEMILEAYAKGDKATLKPLLAKPVFDSFVSVIDQDQKRGHSKVFQFVGVKSASLQSALLEGKRAVIVVQFVSEMINATLDKAGATLEGDPKFIAEVTDLWTFERDVTSRDPNWKLVATGDAVE